MKARTAITVGLPFYNNHATLADAIRSVVAQTYRDWELILVDDGSSDGSLRIAGAVRDPRVRVVSDGVNRGLETRLNEIVDLARGDYVARMDADDLMHPERLALQVRHLEENRDVQVVGTGVYAVDARGAPVGKRACAAKTFHARGILKGDHVIHATVLGRKAFFREHPYHLGFSRAEDFELWCRAYARSKARLALLPAPLYFVREEGSVTLKKMLASYRSVRRALWVHGPKLAGWRATCAQVARIRAKEAAYRLFALLGKEMALVRRRNEPLSPAERLAAADVIGTILRTPVPGLTETPCACQRLSEKPA